MYKMLTILFGCKIDLYLIPLFCLGSTRSVKGADAGEESARFAALCALVKQTNREEGEERDSNKQKHASRIQD